MSHLSKRIVEKNWARIASIINLSVEYIIIVVTLIINVVQVNDIKRRTKKKERFD